MNESKLLIVRPTSKLRTTLLNIKLNDYLLTPEKSAKYLDINIDKTFLEQINWNSSKKLIKRNKILSKLQLNLLQPFPTLHYIGLTIWSMSRKIIMKSFIFQKRYLQLLTFSDWQEHTISIFKTFKIIKLHNIQVSSR